jgi:hypothetical protein
MKLDSKIPSGPIEQKWDKHRFDMKLVNPANKRKFTLIVVGHTPIESAMGRWVFLHKPTKRYISG